MASLFQRKKKTPVVFDDSDVQLKLKPIQQLRRTASKKREYTDFSVDSDDDALTSTKRVSTNDGNSKQVEDDYKAEIAAQVAAVKAKSGVSNEKEGAKPVIDLDLTAVEDEFDKTAKEVLRKISNTKRQASMKPSSSSSQSSQPEIVDLDDEPTFVVPTVARGSARVTTAPRAIDEAVLSVEHLRQLAGNVPNGGSTQPRMQAVPPEKPQCRLRTRLNGKHEHKWKLGFEEPFSKMKGMLATLFGLKASDVKFEFDGEAVGDDDTPQSLDMENDMLVDVKVRKELYDAAVQTAESNRAATAAVPAAPAAPALPLPEKHCVKIKTRLNGKHECKWKLVVSDPFSKLRANLAVMYGLEDAKLLTLEFDGDGVCDTQTPEALDVEDDNIIDVKVDKKLYDKAIEAAANAKR